MDIPLLLGSLLTAIKSSLRSPYNSSARTTEENTVSNSNSTVARGLLQRERVPLRSLPRKGSTCCNKIVDTCFLNPVGAQTSALLHFKLPSRFCSFAQYTWTSGFMGIKGAPDEASAKRNELYMKRLKHQTLIGLVKDNLSPILSTTALPFVHYLKINE
jgi:hypothetical protein